MVVFGGTPAEPGKRKYSPQYREALSRGMICTGKLFHSKEGIGGKTLSSCGVGPSGIFV